MISYEAKIDSTALQRLQQSFRNAPDITAHHVMQAVNQALVQYQSTAKELAPIRDGALRSSIQVTSAMRNGSSIKGSVGTNLSYAEAQEAGAGIYGPSGTPI